MESISSLQDLSSVSESFNYWRVSLAHGRNEANARLCQAEELLQALYDQPAPPAIDNSDMILLWKLLLVRIPPYCLRDSCYYMGRLDGFWCTLRETWGLAGKLAGWTQETEALAKLQQELIKVHKGKDANTILALLVEPFSRVLAGLLTSKRTTAASGAPDEKISLQNAFVKTFEVAAEAYSGASSKVRRKLQTILGSIFLLSPRFRDAVVKSPRATKEVGWAALAAAIASSKRDDAAMAIIMTDAVLTMQGSEGSISLSALEQMNKSSLREWYTHRDHSTIFKHLVDRGLKRHFAPTMAIISLLLPTITDLIDDDWFIHLLHEYLASALESRDEVKCTSVLKLLTHFRPLSREDELLAVVISIVQKAKQVVQAQARSWMLKGAQLLISRCNLKLTGDLSSVVNTMLASESNDECRRHLIDIQIAGAMECSQAMATWEKLQPVLRSEALLSMVTSCGSDNVPDLVCERLKTVVPWCREQILSNKDKVASRPHSRRCMAVILYALVQGVAEESVDESITNAFVANLRVGETALTKETAEVLSIIIDLLIRIDWEKYRWTLADRDLLSVIMGATSLNEKSTKEESFVYQFVETMLRVIDYAYTYGRGRGCESQRSIRHRLQRASFAPKFRRKCLAALAEMAGTVDQTGCVGNECFRTCLSILTLPTKEPIPLDELFGDVEDAATLCLLVKMHPRFSTRSIGAMKGLRRWVRRIIIFPPSRSFADYLTRLIDSRDPLIYKEAVPNLFKLSHDLIKQWVDRQEDSLRDYRAFGVEWRESLFNAIHNGMVPMFDAPSLVALLKNLEAPPAPKAVAAPKAKLAKLTPAQARLLAARKSTDIAQSKTVAPAPAVPVKDRITANIELAAKCIATAAQHWSDLVATGLPQLVPRLIGMLSTPLVAFPAYTLLTHLTEAYVDLPVVPERRLISPCLLQMTLPDTKPPVAMAETICTSLSEDQVMTFEASNFVLPIIAFLLSPSASTHVSLVAVHRAASVLSHQLRLGASMNVDEVLESVSSVIKLRPSLAGLCGSILFNVPKLADFKPSLHLNPLSQFLETESITLKRTVVSILCNQVHLTNPIDADGIEAFLCRVYCISLDTNDVQSRDAALSIIKNKDFEAAFKTFVGNDSRFLDAAILLLSTPSDAFAKLVANGLATRFIDNHRYAIEKVTEAWTTRYAPETKKDDQLRIKGFELRPEDVEAFATELKNTKGQERIPNPRGRYGIIEALGALGGIPDLDIDTIKHVSNFILLTALKVEWMEEDLLTRIEHLVTYFCAANVKHAGFHVDFLRNEMLSKCTASDFSKASCLQMLGMQCKNLAPTNPRLLEVYKVLESELLTATNALRIKKAIGKSLHNVLGPLMKEKLLDNDVVLKKFKDSAIEVKDVRIRVGGALGLASMIKALGVIYLKDSDLFKSLSTICIERKETHSRHGGFLCFEAILDTCGRLIETYAPQILPTLLSGFSDMQAVVREAAGIVARKLMSCLSGVGLKSILPDLLKVAQESTNWRSKVGSIELLGHVASVSPSHLVSVLNQVMPVLCENAHDSHKEVKHMASQALTTLINVIVNPELKQIQDPLLQCLIDLNDKTTQATLETLLHLEFRHFLDGTCLAFLMPVILRGLRASKAETRQKAAHLVAVIPFICIDREIIMTPYIKPLVNQLIANLNDPLPEVRQSAAKCLGLLTEAIGGATYQETIPFLIKSLKTAHSSVERSGAANALVEIFHALGLNVLEEHLSDILKQADSNPNSGVREGFLGLFVYMPLIFGEKFEKFVPQVLPVLLRALSSEEEPVRDISFRASQIFVNQYGASHTPLLLQPLEKALFDPHVEVRLRAVSLLGLLVEKILKGVEDSTAEGGQLMQLEILSLERRAYILSSLYLARSDEEPDVRSGAASTWKVVVQNTPKTVRELLPILTRRLLDLLGSENPVKEGVAQRCMEELVLKHGERLVPEVMNTFMENLKDPKMQQSRGLFLGLEALIRSAPRPLLKQHMSQLTPLIRDALKTCQDDASRKQIINVINIVTSKGEEAPTSRASAKSAQQAQNVNFFEPFLDELFNPPVFDLGKVTDKRLDVLKTIEIFLVTQTTVMLTEIFKRCNVDPIDLFKIWAIGLIHVSPPGTNIVHLWDTMLSILRRGFAETFPTSAYFNLIKDPHSFRNEIRDSLLKVITAFPQELPNEALISVADILQKNKLTIDGGAGGWAKLLSLTDPNLEVETFDLTNMTSIVEQFSSTAIKNSESSAVARGFAFCIASALAHTQVTEVPRTDLFSVITLPLLVEVDLEVLNIGAEAFAALVKKMDRECLIALGIPLNEMLLKATTPSVPVEDPPTYLLPALNKKIVLENISSILQTSLLYGSLPAKEASASAFLTVCKSADPVIFASVAVKSVGPLIRVFADRVPAGIKSLVLQTLVLTLQKTEAALRPLVAQLQSTFLKCLLDPNSDTVRHLAAIALKQLAPLAGPRVDLLAKELAKLLGQSSQDPRAVLDALGGVYETSHSGISEATQQTCWDALMAYDCGDDQSVLSAKGRAMSIMLSIDLKKTESIWGCEIIGKLEDPAVLSSLRHFLGKSENVEWVQSKGLMTPLLEAIIRRATTSMDQSLAKLISALSSDFRNYPEPLALIMSALCLQLQQAGGSVAAPTDATSALLYLETLIKLAEAAPISKETRLEMSRRLSPLLRSMNPAIKLQTERLFTIVLKDGKIAELTSFAKSEPQVKFLVEYHQRVLARQ